jgi:hypothetical protein
VRSVEKPCHPFTLNAEEYRRGRPPPAVKYF